MIRFFKSSFIIQFCAICITGLILWGRAFFEPPLLPEPEGFVPFYSFLFSLLSGFPLIQVISGCFLVTGSALILNHVLSNHRIVQKNSSLAGFIFIILMSYHPVFLTIHPVNIAVFFILLILNQLFQSYNKEEPLDLIYSAGFFVTISSCVYFPSVFFYGFILISFIIFRSGKWREWISSFFGLLTPFLFLSVYYFWTDQLMARMLEYLGMFTIHPVLKFSENPVYIILTSVIILFFLFSLVYSISARTEKTIEKKRKNLLFNWVILFVLVSFPFASNMTLYHIELAFITFSGLIAFYLLQIRKSFWQELIFILLLLFLISNNLFFRVL
jgi:hypothetical protein